MRTTLNNTAATNVAQIQRVTIVNPCTSTTITVGAVTNMQTLTLSSTAVTQTLSYWPDAASTAAGVANMCGASTFTLAGTYSASFISISGTTITLLSTLLSDFGTYTNV